MIRWLKEMLLLNLLLVPPMVFFPAICWLLAAHPDPTAAQACFWFGPLSAGFWVLVYSQWSSVHAWQRAGRLKQWREDHGGILRTIPRTCGWMFGALFFSYLAEFVLLGIARRAARPWLPLATYSPVAFCWLWRRSHA